MTGTGAASAAPTSTLEQLAKRIQGHLQTIKDAPAEAERSQLQAAIAAGHDLIRAKAQLKDDEGPKARWLPWLEKNFDLGEQSARDYMMLARNEQKITSTAGVFSIRAALEVARPPVVQRKPREKADKPPQRQRSANVSDEDYDKFKVLAKSQGQSAADRLGELVREDLGESPAPTPKPQPPKKPKATEGGKRVRQLHADKRAGQRDGESQVFKMQVALAESVGYLERFDLPDLEWSEDVQDVLNDIVYDLERMRAWNERAWDTVWAKMDDVGRQRRLRELRKRADDPSSTSWERRNASELADKMEKKYRHQKGLEAG
jgi:hypothetical protein